MWKKLLFYRGATERKIKGEEFGSGCSCYVLSLDVYYCVELYDRYMHQILMPLCLMNTVYKQVLVWFLLTAVSAQHTSTCRPDPTHEYKTNGLLSLISKVAIPPLSVAAVTRYCTVFQGVHLLKTMFQYTTPYWYLLRWIYVWILLRKSDFLEGKLSQRSVQNGLFCKGGSWRRWENMVRY